MLFATKRNVIFYTDMSSVFLYDSEKERVNGALIRILFCSDLIGCQSQMGALCILGFG